MAIAGIEGLAQGLIQGMALKRQNDRQDVLDAQNLERFGMDKERFATQQAASAFELQNAQTNAANAAIDRKRTLAIQANQDAFDVKMKRLLSTGDDNLATLAEVEKVHHEDGVKGAFLRDPKTGVILTDAKGFATWINADGSPPQKHTGDSARKLFFAKQYPKDAMTREINNADTIAKEEREAKRSDAIAARDDKYATKRLYTADAIADGNVKETPLSAADFKIFFGEDYEIGKDANGLPKMGNRINRQLQNRFLTWASVNKRKATMSAYQDWVANDPAAQALSTQNGDMGGNGVLKDIPVKGLEEINKVDMTDKPPLVLGNQGAAQPVSGAPKGLTVNPSAASNQQSATPTEESIAKPVTKTQVVSKRQGRGVQMSAPKTIIYQEIQGKFGDPIPDGFKRKKAPFGTDVRTPEYNVFVSKNYDEYND